MPDLTPQTFVTRDPGAYDSEIVGTAAGTAQVSKEPCFFQGILIPTQVAGGVITIYDSLGTSLTVVGTITLGTSPTNNAPPLYEFKRAMKTGLTVVNSANQGAIVLYK